MDKTEITELLKIAEQESKKTSFQTRKFDRTEDGKLILNPDDNFEKEWFENDQAYEILI